MQPSSEVIWREFSTNLKWFIYKRVRDEQVADDILQDVFIKIHTHLSALNDERKVESWIYQITRNAIADHYRQPQGAWLPDEGLALVESAEPEDAEATLARGVRGMIDRLPEEYREALILDAFEGLSQQEIGARLGISLSGAKSRVQRARTKLRDMLFDCCHFEFDRLGKVIDYYPRADCCRQCGCERR